ncbi:MAG: 2OG-Fe(II) oxygenase [Ilumatobacteraceae bacterium]|nr:2OG-Fe(II) oxygenase [Ilumatobacteraceae bacterium]
MTSGDASPGSPVASVDLRDFTAGDEPARAAFVDVFGRSLVDTGFVKVAGHGIDPAAIAAAYAAAEAVFALADDVKLASSRDDLHGARGFIPFGREQAKDASIIDLKEFWHIGPPAGGRHPNVWPDEVPAFEATMTALFAAMETTAETLLEALACFLGLPRRRLADLVVGADSLLRVLHYPALRDRFVAGAVRAAAHEDINFITLLPAATDAGLELLDRDGRWLPVDGLDGQIVVDSGDMLSRFLNGRVPATTHRVVNPHDPDAVRYSMPFFCQPRRDLLLVPPAELMRPGEELRDPPITAGEFHQQRMDQIRLRRRA